MSRHRIPRRRRGGAAAGTAAVIAVTIAVAIAVAIPWGCRPPSEEGRPAVDPGGTAFVITLGDDTILVEAIEREAGRVVVAVIERSPEVARSRFTYELGDDGALLGYTAEREVLSDPEADALYADAELGQGTARVIRRLGDRVDTTSFAVGPGVVPSIGMNPLLMFETELAMRANRRAGEAELLNVFGAGASPLPMDGRGSDTLSYAFFGRPMLAWTDADQRIAGLTGRETTYDIEATAVSAPSLDLDRLATDWTNLHVRGEGIGVPSPYATVEAVVGGARLTVRYSRPAKRGRRIWGGLVPYGQVWRTGANEATQLTTDGNLRIGDLDVPAGSYTLWSTYSAGAGTLIVSRTTDIWGTDYDPEGDLGRAAMGPTRLESPLERFTLTIEPSDGVATLVLAWDDLAFSVPIVDPSAGPVADGR